MHIETLKVFCDIADLGSFSKTAEKHLMTQSGVSQQLAQLETIHKCQFIDRRKRPLELTPAGRLFYKAAAEIVDRYERFKSDLSTLKAEAATRINIGAIYSTGMHTLQKYVKQFLTKHPKVNVHIEYFTAEYIYDNVLSGEIDIGIVAVPKKDKRLEVYDFEDEPLVLVCSPRHPLARQSDIDIHQLQYERFIAFEAGVPTRLWIDAIFDRYNIVIRPVMEFDNVETVKRAVEINSGVAILPKTVIAQELASGTIRALQFTNEHFVRPTGIILRKDRVLTLEIKFFVELLRKKD